MNLEELKNEYRRLTNPTADWHWSEDDVAQARQAVIDAGGAEWVVKYDAELVEWDADIEASAEDV